MTEFELLVIPVSLILGLGCANVLEGLIRAVHRREQAPMHWVPIVWGFGVLLYTVGYFNVLYDLYEEGRAWTWALYGPVLMQTLLIFLSAGLLFPRETADSSQGMLESFERHGRLALLPLALLLGSAPLMNRLQSGADWYGLGNAFNVVLTVVLLVAWASKGRAVQAVTPIAFAVLTLGGFLVAWSQPGVS